MQVSVYAALEGGCLRGRAQPFTGRRAFLGNGRLMVSRADTFRDNKPGIGVRMEERKGHIKSKQYQFLFKKYRYRYLRNRRPPYKRSRLFIHDFWGIFDRHNLYSQLKR